MSSLHNQLVENLKKRHLDKPLFLSILKEIHLLENTKEENSFILTVPSLLYKDRVEKNFMPFLKKELASLLKKDSVQIYVKTHMASKTTTPPLPPLSASQKPKKSLTFNPLFTFDSFVAGPSNSLAFESLKHVGENPFFRPFSPLFIYSQTGLGKTHLLHSLGWHLSQKEKPPRIQYLSAERFLHQFVTSIRLNNMESFRNQFRQDCQILLIDDIQSIEKAPTSQEEFFHTFNAITEKGGLVVCTCDRLPFEIKKMETRIQTRLSGGLVIEISPPNMETRLAILQKKSSQKKLKISNEALSFIAQKSSKASVRELEGILNKIKMICSLQNQEPTLDFIKETLLSDFGGSSNTVEGIIQQVASKHLISPSLLVSSSRIKNVVYARSEALILAHKKFPQLSLTQLGRIFGGRSHSTILHILKTKKNLPS